MLKTCVVTGASSGIGFALARQLAVRGREVILVCREAERGHESLKRVRTSAPQGRAELLIADLGIQSEVRRAAAEIAAGWPSINVLINNAAVGCLPNRTLTADGVEVTFAVNCIAPFLLTNLLQQSLSRGAPSRVINVVGRANQADLPLLDDLQLSSGYSGCRARCRSQLALLLLSQELARRFAPRAITVNCIDPGPTRTALFAEAPLAQRILTFPAYLMSQAPHEAAWSIAQLAEGLEYMRVTGMYFSRFERKPLRSGILDETSARALWDKVAGLCTEGLVAPRATA